MSIHHSYSPRIKIKRRASLVFAVTTLGLGSGLAASPLQRAPSSEAVDISRTEARLSRASVAMGDSLAQADSRLEAEITVREALERAATPSARGNMRLRLDAANQTPVFVSGRFALGASLSAEEKARAFLDVLAPHFRGIAPRRQLQLDETRVDALGYTHLRFQQYYGEIPIEGGQFKVHIDPEGYVTSANGHLAPDVHAPGDVQVGSDQATLNFQQKLQKVLEDPSRPPYSEAAYVLEPVGSPELKILAGRSGVEQQTQNLAWEIRLGQWISFVDAQSGEVLRYTLFGDAYNVDTYSCNGGSSLPGTLMASTDPEYLSSEIDEEEAAAHGYALEYASLLLEAFGRDSIDDAGARLEQSVEYSTMANAYWDGYSAVFGTGWATRDIVGHEFTHGLVEYTADLVYSDEPGALNESFADIFAVMVDRDDWLQGEEADGFSEDDPVRSLSDPHKGDRFHPEQSYDSVTNSGQPAHYDELLTSSDPLCGSTGDSSNGCVHFNSGIQNHAAYLLSEGGIESDIYVVGVGHSDTEQVFYRDLLRLTAYSDMMDSRDSALVACGELYGEGSLTCISTQNAFAAVGLGEAQYNTLTVALDGSGDYTSIQAAVDAAETGDHIEIAEGTYAESVVLSNASVMLEGAGTGATLLQGDGSQPVIQVIGSSSDLLLRQLSISGSGGAQGGGILCNGATLDLENVSLNENNTDGDGAALLALDCEVSATNLEAQNNTAAGNGGAIALSGGSLDADGLTLSGNTAGGSGGGLFVSGDVSLTESVLEQNEALSGGAIFVDQGASLEVSDSAFSQNVASGGAGGGISSLGTMVLSSSDVDGNVAASEGGGIFAEGALELRTCAITNNSSDEDGGGLYVNASAELLDLSVNGNSATGNGGGLAFASDASAEGSALLVYDNDAAQGGGAALLASSDVWLHNSILSSNIAQAGGGILAAGGNAGELINISVVDNDAANGAGIFGADSSSLLLDSAIVAFNSSGSAVEYDASSAVTISYSDIYDGSTAQSGQNPSDNLGEDPGFEDFSADRDATNDDLHLASSSACIDAGNPDSSLNDIDSTRNDMGAYGGPFVANWPGEYVPCYSGMFSIALGDVVTSSLTSSDPSDGPRGSGYYYEDSVFYAEAGTDIYLYLDASFDAYMYLYGPDCTRLTSNDDGGSGTDSLITYTTAEAGYYTVIATSYYSSTTGSYELTTQ